MQRISRQVIIKEIARCGSVGIPWETIDDTLCRPEGSYRRHVEVMISSGDLVDRDGCVFLATQTPLRTPKNSRWIARRNSIIDVLRFFGVAIERRCNVANRIMRHVFGECPPMV
jgi:hypothetical protein